MARKKNKTRAAEPQPKQDLWATLPEWKKHLLAAVVLVVLSLVFFAPIHFSGKQLVGGDAVGWRSLAESMLEYREATGEEPLWSTNAFSGMPGYFISYRFAVPQVDTVFNLLRNVIWPSSHFIVLLLGTYVCGYMLTRRSLPSIFAAVAFGFTTYIPVFLAAGHNSKFIALAFAPWLIAALLFVLRRPGPIPGLLFAVVVAAALRAGHIQIIYYFAVVGLIMTVANGVTAIRRGEGRSFGMALMWLVLGGIVGIVMVAQPYLSIYEYKTLSIRGSGALSATADSGLDWSYAMAWSQGRSELLTLLVADAMGGSQVYWGPKIFTGGPHYFGAAAITLAIVGAVFVRRTAVTALTVATILVIAFSLGENLAFVNRTMFNIFPMFSSFRVPETWLSAAAFTTALLAAVGIAYLVDSARETASKMSRELYAFAGVAGLLIILLVGHSSFLSFDKPGEYARISSQIAQENNVSPDDPRVAQTADQILSEIRDTRREAFRDDTIRSLIVVVLIGLLVFFVLNGKLSASLFMAACVLVVVADLTTVARRYLSEEHLSSISDVTEHIPEYEFDRFIQQQVDEVGGPGRFRTLSFEGDPTSTARPSYYYENAGGYHAAKLQIYQDYLNEVLRIGRGAPSSLGLDLMSIRYIVAPTLLPGLEPAFRDEQTGLLVLENDDYFERVRFVGEVIVEPDPRRTLEIVTQASANLRTTALVAEQINVAPAPIDSASVATASVTTFDARHIVADVETDSDRLLVFSEVYYPAGWHAEIDGEPAPIVRTNYLQRGVIVPAGSHTVSLKFNPSSHSTGILVSAVATAIVYGLLVVALIRMVHLRRKEGAGAEANGAHQ